MKKELKFNQWDIPLKQILTTDELARVIAINYREKEKAIAQGKKTPVIDWMILNTSLWGLRISESAFLECGQIYLNSQTSHLDLKHTKGNKPRIVIIDDIFARYQFPQCHFGQFSPGTRFLPIKAEECAALAVHRQ